MVLEIANNMDINMAISMDINTDINIPTIMVMDMDILKIKF